jgi:hypothetical protein
MNRLIRIYDKEGWVPAVRDCVNAVNDRANRINYRLRYGQRADNGPVEFFWID